MSKKQKSQKQSGFTLIEILVVIGIIAVLAAIVLIAINPAKQFAQSRNTQRTSNLNALSSAIGQRLADNKGIFAGTFTVGGSTYTCPDLGTLTVGTAYSVESTVAAGNLDLSCLSPTYIPTLPFDPSLAGSHWTSGADYDTGYTLSKDAAGRLTACAPEAANENAVPNAAAICITR